MKIFVINIETARVRREALLRAMNATGIDVEVFAAITPAGDPLRFFAGIDRRTFLLETGRTGPRPSEVACYASHLMLWQKCVAIDEPMVVLEDDVEPTDRLNTLYPVLESLTEEYGFIRLEEPWERPNYFRGQTIADPRVLVVAESVMVQLIHPTYVSLGASAYALAPAAARRLLAASLDRPLACPVDNFFRRTWIHQQPMFYLEPAPFRLGALSNVTQIEGRQSGALTARWLRKLRRLPKRPYMLWARHASRRESQRVRNGLLLRKADVPASNMA